ncbi:hypothetical protein BD410DRAFT_800001 [Rickenella mellea]|uniref:Uncharacterized protein n=1 Tax=Rickenella mellea TaxID=50990 RepID=A0A4Y7QIG6_9AGAM|nr:hypothetical protein BD410DRAFT_800001 [Rickenella mellea]
MVIVKESPEFETEAGMRTLQKSRRSTASGGTEVTPYIDVSSPTISSVSSLPSDPPTYSSQLALGPAELYGQSWHQKVADARYPQRSASAAHLRPVPPPLPTRVVSSPVSSPSSPTSVVTEVPTYHPNEEQWMAALRDLQSQVDAVNKGSAPRTKAGDKGIVRTMRRLATLHPDPLVKSAWSERAATFAKGNREEKETVLGGLAKGCAILLVTPFALASATIFATGYLLYGTGKIVVGLGHMMTFGQLKKR